MLHAEGLGLESISDFAHYFETDTVISVAKADVIAKLPEEKRNLVKNHQLQSARIRTALSLAQADFSHTTSDRSAGTQPAIDLDAPLAAEDRKARTPIIIAFTNYASSLR